MTARDDYSKMAHWTVGRAHERASELAAEMQAALDEIDELRSTVEELSMQLYEATYHS